MALLYEPLDTALGTTSKIRLLRALLPLTQAVSGREAARRAGVAWAPAAHALQELVALGILDRQEAPGRHL